MLCLWNFKWVFSGNIDLAYFRYAQYNFHSFSAQHFFFGVTLQLAKRKTRSKVKKINFLQFESTSKFCLRYNYAHSLHARKSQTNHRVYRRRGHRRRLLRMCKCSRKEKKTRATLYMQLVSRPAIVLLHPNHYVDTMPPPFHPPHSICWLHSSRAINFQIGIVSVGVFFPLYSMLSSLYYMHFFTLSNARCGHLNSPQFVAPKAASHEGFNWFSSKMGF